MTAHNSHTPGSPQLKLAAAIPPSTNDDNNGSRRASMEPAPATNDISINVPAPITIKQPDQNKWETLKQNGWAIVSVVLVPLALLLLTNMMEKANETTAQSNRETESVTGV
ncbi:hypothetical protein [Leptothoe kymatousa]|uniref:ER membrane protein complex subunit 4 n=1 Tax=Leptothoe kymatousa TAU-MAC 1615 TaxID=2364775 RepID=A0ABS5Y4M1_9CYAN|nr:hypothetical protein [Leptothoe kymatousa]MBT9312783.1 hypothetical protein [Leptothoe kymatousa TAU-MAC 1615]